MWLEKVKNALQDAESGVSKLQGDVLDFQGMTSPKIKHFLNNICSNEDVCYFEVGLGTGSTHYPALFKNEHVKAFAADIWLTKKVGDNGKQNFLDGYEYMLGKLRTKVFDGDSFTIDLKEFFGEDKVNVYFYDGAHEAEAHYKALEYFLPVLADQFVYIIDDWNDDRVQDGTMKSLQELPVKVLFCDDKPAVLGTTPGVWGDMTRWWNGLRVMVLEKLED